MDGYFNIRIILTKKMQNILKTCDIEDNCEGQIFLRF